MGRRRPANPSAFQLSKDPCFFLQLLAATSTTRQQSDFIVRIVRIQMTIGPMLSENAVYRSPI